MSAAIAKPKRIEGEVSVGCPSPSSSPSGEEWKSFQFHIRKFETLDTKRIITLHHRNSHAMVISGSLLSTLVVTIKRLKEM
jgi:hypothetical protein